MLAAGLAFGEGDHPGLQYVLAFGAVPASAALALAADRLRPILSVAAGAFIDLVVFGTALLAFPDRAGATVAALLVPVLMAGATGGRRMGLAVGGAGLVVITTANVDGRIDVPIDVLLLLVIAIAACLAVVGRADARLLRSTRSARSFEARATRLLEQLAQPVVGVDAEGRVTLVNDASRELLGELAAGEVRCAAYLGLEADGQPVDCSRGCGLLAVDGATDAGGIEATVCGPRGTPVPVLVSVTEVPSPDGESTESIHTLRDITRLKLADEAKTLFLATATHELKTPLTVIRGFLETIDRPDVGEDLRATAMGVMRNRADELSAIIERILLASRIEAGQVQVETGPVDVVEIARERVAALAAATGRTLSLQSIEGVPAARADGLMLATVVDHLVDNACKYSERGDVVDVRITFDEASVVVTVRDEGHGMTAEQAAHCFDRFWQADPTSRRRAGGTGIGLFIVRSVVESMRGTVMVRSVLGEGSTFTVSLHRADIDPAADDGDEALVAARPSSPAPDEASPEPSIVREFMRQIGVEPKEPIG